MASEKRIFIIAGPNGAGKTTFALEFLPRERFHSTADGHYRVAKPF